MVFRKSLFAEGWGWMLRSPPRAALTCRSSTSRLLWAGPPRAAFRFPPPRPPGGSSPGPLWPEHPLVSLVWPSGLGREARVGELSECAYGIRARAVKTGSAPGTRSRPAPSWRGLSRTYLASPGLHPLWRPWRALEPFDTGDPPVYKVCFGLQRPESNPWTPFMGSAPLWGPVSIRDPFGP